MQPILQGSPAALADYLYDTASDPTAWRQFLEALMRSCRGTARVLIENKPRAGGTNCRSASEAALGRAALQPLAFAAGTEERQRSLAIAAPSNTGRPTRLESILLDDDWLLASLSMSRPGGFSCDEVSTWENLGPHLRRAVKLRMQFIRANCRADPALLVLDAMGVGMVVVNHEGMLLFASPIAEKILQRAEGLTVICGRLRVAPAIRDEFATLLRRTTIIDRNSAPRGGEVILLPRECGERPISALVLRHTTQEFAFSGPSAIIFLSDPLRRLDIREQDFSSLYGLTAAEAKLLREIVRGVSLADYAACTGIARNTAKTYLHQIFAKTGQSRQADLIREILSDPLLQLAGAAGQKKAQRNSA